MEEIRLNKYLSEAGFCSRREADRLIEAGKILVDGVPASMGMKVREGQKVSCGGTVIGGGSYEDGGRKEAGAAPQTHKAPPVLLAVNKPRGIVCTTSDKDRARNIVEFLDYPVRIYPVGRLDKDSEGLLLMTNQGELVNQIMKSRQGHEKEYLVTVDKPVTAEFISAMRKGVPILDTVTRPCFAEKTGKNSFRIILTQGLNRQIRRMCEYLGYRVNTLKRVRIMNIRLGNLQTGEYRKIKGREYEELLRQLKNTEKEQD